MKDRISVNVKVGNDNGNSEHDIVINGSLVTQPNVFARAKELPMLDEMNPEFVASNIESNLLITIASSIVRPGIYFIGDYARKSGKRLTNIEVGADNSKVDSDVVIVNTLGHIAGQVVKEAYKRDNNFTGSIHVNVDMTTALPVTQYNKINANALADKFMSKEHKLIVHVGSNEVEVNVKFEYVKVVPESVPTVFYLQSMTEEKINSLKDESVKEKIKGEINKLFKEFNETYGLNIDGNYFKNKKMLHIGIGEGTTEYPITKDIVFDPNFIKGSDNGVGHAIENALPAIKTEYQLRTFSRQDYSNILRHEGHKYYNFAKDEVEQYLEDEATDIFQIAKKELEKANNDVDIICVHGGGSILMKEYLYTKLFNLCNKTGIKLFYVPEEFAVTLECKGMYEFVNAPIFKALKKKYSEQVTAS